MGNEFCCVCQETHNFYTMKLFLFVTLATLAVYALATPEPKNVITCTIYTDLVQILDDTITGDSTIEQVHDILYRACGILVGMEQDCYDFVDANLEKIIDLLVTQYLSPEAICNELTLCP